MNIYDVEVLNIQIDDRSIAEMLVDSQHDTVEQNLRIQRLTKELEYTKKHEKLQTTIKYTEVKLKEIESETDVKTTKEEKERLLVKAKLDAEAKDQPVIDSIVAAKVKREKSVEELKTQLEKNRTEIKVAAIEREMAAIQPRLIEAMISQGNVKLAETLAKNLKSSRSGLDGLFSGGGFKEILETIKGSPLESKVASLMEEFKNLGNEDKK